MSGSFSSDNGVDNVYRGVSAVTNNVSKRIEDVFEALQAYIGSFTSVGV